ncbi:MAG: hypothetical protein ACOC96_05755 [Actinomycetota bacterium]
MAVIALTSARGAPGVTTTALALTLVWPRPAVLVEADAAGSSSVGAGYLRGNLDPNRGLISFAVAHRAGELTTDTVREQALPLTDDDTKLFVPGLASADQVGSLTPDLWDRLGGVLAALDRAGTDVLVDAGRLGAVGGPDPLLEQAQMVLLVLSSSLDAVVSARARVGQLRNLRADSVSGPDGLGLLLVGEGRPYRAAEVAKAVGLPVVATVSHDEPNAQVLSHGAPRSRKFDVCPLVRSTRSAAEEIQGVAAARTSHLAPPVTASGEVLDPNSG